MLVLGFASGLPFALAGAALQAWMATSQVDIKTLGVYTLVTVPYGFKFVWAPTIDRYALPLIGRRRGWMLVAQLLLIGCCLAFTALEPPGDVEMMAWVALALAFFSATYDIAFDAYRTEVLEEHERGIGVAASIGGWRLGNLMSAGLAFVIADQVGWHWTYATMGISALAGIGIGLWLAPPPAHISPPPASLGRAIIDPFVAFVREYKRLTWALLLLIVLYRLGDAFASSLTTAFLVMPPEWLAEPFGLQSGVGFSLSEVGVVNKGFAFASILAGTAIGGVLMARWTLFKCLLVFGVLQCVSNLAFVTLSMVGPAVEMLAVVVIVENLAGGLGTAALVALIMALCDQRYTATQFALLTALASLGRYAAASSGFIQASLGWPGFFIVTTIVAIPGVVLVLWLRKPLLALEQRAKEDGAEPSS